jgi:hypothetical protein
MPAPIVCGFADDFPRRAYAGQSDAGPLLLPLCAAGLVREFRSARAFSPLDVLHDVPWPGRRCSSQREPSSGNLSLMQIASYPNGVSQNASVRNSISQNANSQNVACPREAGLHEAWQNVHFQNAVPLNAAWRNVSYPNDPRQPAIY